MEKAMEIVITVFCSVMASSGFWMFLQKRDEKKSNQTQLLIGLAHDRILSLGTSYLARGDWITQDEYENLNKYLYEPYSKSGGNGSAQKVMNEINAKLHIVVPTYVEGGKIYEKTDN